MHPIESRQTRLTLRTPLKGKRMLLGCGLIAIGLAILSTFHMNGMVLELFWIALLPVCAGMGFAGLDYVVRIESIGPVMVAGWEFCGLAVGRQKHQNLAGVDRVVIAHRRLPVTSPTGSGSDLRPVYPVWLMSKTGCLDYLLGWRPEYLKRVSSGFFIKSRPPNFAVFLAWARFVAAQAALCLNVPIFDEKTGKSYGPGEIPAAWLQREGLNFDSHREEA